VKPKKREIVLSFAWAKEIIHQRLPSIGLILFSCIFLNFIFQKPTPISAEEQQAMTLGWEPWQGPSLKCSFQEGPGYYLIQDESDGFEVFLRENGQVLASRVENANEPIPAHELTCLKIPGPSQIEEVRL
jgi:hypothetical protein